jgi:hypothetical protein
MPELIRRAIVVQAVLEVRLKRMTGENALHAMQLVVMGLRNACSVLALVGFSVVFSGNLHDAIPGRHFRASGNTMPFVTNATSVVLHAIRIVFSATDFRDLRRSHKSRSRLVGATQVAISKSKCRAFLKRHTGSPLSWE